MPQLGKSEWNEANSADNSVQYLLLDLDNYQMVQNRYEHICNHIYS